MPRKSGKGSHTHAEKEITARKKDTGFEQFNTNSRCPCWKHIAAVSYLLPVDRVRGRSLARSFRSDSVFLNSSGLQLN